MKYFFLAVFFLLCPLEGREVRNILQTVPSKDREKIEQLFSHLVQCENLGFVLFSDTKPAAICAIPIVCHYAVVPSSYISAEPLRYQKTLKQCWEVWRQYEQRFKHPNIIICKEYFRCKKVAFLHLVFIDKRKLKRILEEYHQDFAEVLGNSFSPDAFIARIEQKKRLRPLIKYDEKLLGLILGFGKESSSGYKDMTLNGKEDPLFTSAGYRPKGCCIVPVSFRGNPDSPEIKALIETYTKEVLEIEQIFKSDSFFTMALEKFCSP